MDVPEPGHEICAPKVDLSDIACFDGAAVGANVADAAVFDQDRCAWNSSRLNAVDQRRVGEESAHRGTT